MLSRPLALLAAAAILASLFLPWFTTPFGENVVPWSALRQMDADMAQRLVENAPPEAIAFGASFVLAALFLLLALVGREFKLLAFVTGAVPVGLVAWMLSSAAGRADAAGLPLSGSDMSEIVSRASEMLGTGAWSWIGGAAVLVLLGLIDPGRRKPRRA